MEEIVEMAKALQITVDQFKKKYLRSRDNKYALVEKKKTGACVFLKDNKCEIYQARPKQCRTFPWWQENLNSEESWRIAASFCEGIQNDAPLHSFEDIQKGLEESS